MQITASVAKLTVAGRIRVSFPAMCCTKQGKLQHAREKRLLCDFPQLKQLEGCWGDILEFRQMTAGGVNQMGCGLQQPQCGSGALQQKGRVPRMRAATASAVE